MRRENRDDTALYKNSPLIILDEPTAALSPQSEYEIYHNFNSLTSGKTVFFISHRLSSCRICDRIILLHNGKLEAIGTHEELLESSELYNRMFSAQAEFVQPNDRRIWKIKEGIGTYGFLD